jgi:predicted phage-related endonuclease
MAIDQAVRAQGIGASEISALFGMNPYQSAWDVWARKTGRLDGVDVPMNRRMRARSGGARRSGL